MTGGSAAAGWTSYAPLSEDRALAATGPGQDLWIVALVLIGTSSILGAINFLVTMFKMRAPGMTLFRMPIMVWTVLVTSVLVLMATPVITSALIMLFIDRNYGGAFFDPSRGGDAILYQNIFWFYSHPAVYVMILPAMGMVSEILPVFSRKPLFGYKAFIFATAAIGALGFSVWAHHMFTTGAVYLPFFSIMPFLIAVPTGVKMFDWVFTMWRGQLMLKTPLLFAIGFLTMFLIGGINGAFSASVPVDFALHDTYWVVAHLHYVLFGGSVFGVMGGFYYWFPKMTGRMMNETVGKAQFVLMFIGFNMTFFPMHELGLWACPGASPTTRRPRAGTSSTWWPPSAGSPSPRAWSCSCGTCSCRSAAARSPATIHGKATRSNGRRPRRRRPITSTTCPEIRSERPVFDARWGRVQALSTNVSVTAHDDLAGRAQSARLDAARHARRHRRPRPRDAPVHHLRGDVLRRPVRRLLQHPRQRRPVAADQPRDVRAVLPAGPAGRHGQRRDVVLVRAHRDDPADHQLVHMPVRDLEDPERRSDPVHPSDGRDDRLGITFLLMQLTDYAILGNEGLTLSSGTFGTTFYTLTGFHGAHVFGGVIMLSVVLYRGMLGQFSGKHYDAVEGSIVVLALRRRRLDPALRAPLSPARQDAGSLGVDRHASTPTPAQRRHGRDHLHHHRGDLLGRRPRSRGP